MQQDKTEALSPLGTLIEWLNQIDNSVFALSASEIELKMIKQFRTKATELLTTEKEYWLSMQAGAQPEREMLRKIIATAFDDGKKYGFGNKYGIKGGLSYFDKYGEELLKGFHTSANQFKATPETAADTPSDEKISDAVEFAKWIKNNSIYGEIIVTEDVWFYENGEGIGDTETLYQIFKSK